MTPLGHTVSLRIEQIITCARKTTLVGRALLCLSFTTALFASTLTPLLALISWVDETTNKTLFTSEDIVRFDWDRQVFELTRSRVMELMATDARLVKPFVVTDSAGQIYRGHFVSTYSSASIQGPVILTNSLEVLPPLYRIDNGYPSGSAGSDVRFNARLKAALADAKLLRPIPQNYSPKPIEVISFETWVEDIPGVRIWPTAYAETFRIGGKALIPIRIARVAGEPIQFTKLKATLILTFADGKKQLSQQILDISPDDIQGSGATVLCKFDKWVSGKISAVPGIAKMKISFLAVRRGCSELSTQASDTISVPVVLLPKAKP